MAPIVNLHPKDKYRPCSVDWYFKNASLWKDNKDEIISTGKVTGASIMEKQKSMPKAKLSLRVQQPDNKWGALNPDNPHYLGQDVSKDNVPCYYLIQSDGSGTYFIQYFFFYAYNGGMIPLKINESGFEAHEADWEYITVMLNEVEKEVLVQAVAYSGHGYITYWDINEKSNPVSPDKLKPITVYSAINSHASYPTAGKFGLKNIPTLIRPFIDGYDKTADGGPVWNTGSNLVQIKKTGDSDSKFEPSWANYIGDWGTDLTISSIVPDLPKRTEGPSGPTTKGFGVNVMGTVNATYKPQGGQAFRCSGLFPNWDLPSKGFLNVVVDNSGKKGVPVFAFDHDKSGSDSRWYSNKQQGGSFDLTSGDGGGGGHEIYLGTTSPVPPDAKGDDKYAVTIIWSLLKQPLDYPSHSLPSGTTLMGSVDVYYAPQDGQGFRCSNNFSDWDTDSDDILFWEIELKDGHKEYPVFGVEHDKSGSDSRWYSGVTNGSCFSVNAQNGGDGGHSIYIGTLSSVPKGVKGSDTYKVKVYKYKS